MTYQYQDDSELCPEEEIYSGPDEIFHNRFFRLAGDPENEEQEMLLRDTLWLIWRNGGSILADNTRGWERSLTTDVVAPIESDRSYKQDPTKSVPIDIAADGSVRGYQRDVFLGGVMRDANGRRMTRRGKAWLTTYELLDGEASFKHERKRSKIRGHVRSDSRPDQPDDRVLSGSENSEDEPEWARAFGQRSAAAPAKAAEADSSSSDELDEAAAALVLLMTSGVGGDEVIEHGATAGTAKGEGEVDTNDEVDFEVAFPGYQSPPSDAPRKRSKARRVPYKKPKDTRRSPPSRFSPASPLLPLASGIKAHRTSLSAGNPHATLPPSSHRPSPASSHWFGTVLGAEGNAQAGPGPSSARTMAARQERLFLPGGTDSESE